jgi:hypothetical protein
MMPGTMRAHLLFAICLACIATAIFLVIANPPGSGWLTLPLAILFLVCNSVLFAHLAKPHCPNPSTSDPRTL